LLRAKQDAFYEIYRSSRIQWPWSGATAPQTISSQNLNGATNIQSHHRTIFEKKRFTTTTTKEEVSKEFFNFALSFTQSTSD
jgi:hypothetical protein